VSAAGISGQSDPLLWRLKLGKYTVRFMPREDGIALDAWTLQLQPAEQLNDMQLGRSVQVKPHTKYRLTGWIRTENVVIAASTASRRVNCVFI